MAGIINFPTATPEEMMSINEVVFANVVKDGDLSTLVDLREGVKTGDRVAWVNPLTMIGKASSGCEPRTDNPTAALIEKKWDLQEFDVRIVTCYKDVEEILYELGLNDGVLRGDISGTDYATFLDSLMTTALDKMYKRFTWFGDKEAANVADGGDILDGVDIEFFNVIDGVFKQIATMIADGDDVVVTAIAANTKASYALQMSEVWDPIANLTSVILDANPQIESETDQVVYVSRFYMNKLKAKMLAQPQYTESQFSKNEQGYATVQFLGHTVVQMNEWDEQIKANIQDGTKYNKPFRALYTTKRNLKVGVPSLSTFGGLNAWYEKKERQYYIEAMDKLDCIVMMPELISIGW